MSNKQRDFLPVSTCSHLFVQHCEIQLVRSLGNARSNTSELVKSLQLHSHADFVCMFNLNISQVSDLAQSYLPVRSATWVLICVGFARSQVSPPMSCSSPFSLSLFDRRGTEIERFKRRIQMQLDRCCPACELHNEWQSYLFKGILGLITAKNERSFPRAVGVNLWLLHSSAWISLIHSKPLLDNELRLSNDLIWSKLVRQWHRANQEFLRKGSNGVL